MSSEKNNLSIQTKCSYIKIEVDDISGYFISYWNLAIKKLVKDYFCSFNLENYPSVKIPLNELNINMVNLNNSILENKNPLLFEEKLFTIKIFFLSSEKELNNDYYQNIKQSYDKEGLNIILYLINEIKDNSNIPKDCTKIINKIKSKSGINDLVILPYNIVYFEKLQSSFTPFLESFSEKISKDYHIKLDNIIKKFESYENEDIDNYEYIEHLVYYFDLLSLINFWDIIKNYCDKFLFKELFFLFKEYDFEKYVPILKYDTKKLKISVKNQNLSRVEFQEYIFYYYIKSCLFLEEYSNLIYFIKIFPYKLNLFMKYFKTEFHYIFWMINYIFNFISYFNSLHDISDIKIIKNEVLLYLYSFSVKFLKLYSYKSKNIYIPDNKILVELIYCIKNKNFKIIEEQMKNLIIKKNEVEIDNFKLFLNDFKDSNNKYYFILNDNKKYLEELLNLLYCINKSNKDYINFEISINSVFEIVYLLIYFCRFKESKNLLVNLLDYKILKEQKIKYIYEYICFILLLVVSFDDKNYDNLKIIIKLLNIKYSTTDKLIKNLNYENKNIIYEILSNYLESFDPKEIKDKEEINFSLDKVLSMQFFGGKNKTIFINKLKNEKQKINYEIINNTGLELNINKINLIFEEIDIDNTSNNKKNVVFTIENDKNTFKKIESFMNENLFYEIEYNDIFKLNNIYKLIEIQYAMNNAFKGIYHVKEKIKLLFSESNININSKIYSSFDSPNAQNANFYYNILCMLKVNILNISDISELKNKSLIIQIIDSAKNDDSFLKIQTELFKSILKPKIPEIIIHDLSIEFPPNSIKNVSDINNLEIPFFFENTNYYSNNNCCIKIKINIKEKKDNNNIILFSYSTFHNIKFSHLFTIGKRFKLLKNNSYLLQTFLSLNIETTKVKVYNLNNITNIDSKQAINMILLLNDKDDDILLKLRNNFMSFSLNNEDNIKYRFCYPEKNILDEIKEMKEIPYHIIIYIDKSKNNNFELLNEIYVNICIKKYKEKKVKLMITINDNNNWSIVGKNKIIEEFGNEKSEKNIKIVLLPLNDGFLQLPDIEFSEFELESDLNFNLNEGNKDNNDDNFDEFEPIEYGTVIEGDKNVLKISPLKEYNLKINLT